MNDDAVSVKAASEVKMGQKTDDDAMKTVLDDVGRSKQLQPQQQQQQIPSNVINENTNKNSDQVSAKNSCHGKQASSPLLSNSSQNIEIATHETPGPVDETVEGIPPREKWTRKWDFIFSCIGYSVGLGNLWRFPYICYKNGGGAFLIPYFLSVFLAGIPMFLLELSLGQYLSVGGLGVWKIAPAFKGVGYSMMIMSAWLNIYYILVLAWALYYLFSSFSSTLPWSTCKNAWNTPLCRSHDLSQSSSNYDYGGGYYGYHSNYNYNKGYNYSNSHNYGYNNNYNNTNTFGENISYTSPVQEFWELKVLKVSGGLEEVGEVHWQLAGTLLLAWVICYFCIWKGIKWTGKVWNDAVTQIFFSYGLVLGSQIALGSYNSYHNNVIKDALCISCVNSCTSLFSGFVIFSVLGFMAEQQGQRVEDVAKSGPGLAFLAYPSAISQMPLSPLWSVLFFLTLFFVGLDSQFCTIEGFVTAVVDEWPRQLRRRKELVVLVTCILSFLVGLSMVTQGGIYVFELLSHFSGSGTALMVLVFFEAVAVSWSYGVDRYMKAVEDMVGYMPGRWWKWCWSVFTPLVCFIGFILSKVLYKELTYNNYHYPWWGLLVGWFIMLSALALIPIYPFYLYLRTSGSFGERMKKMFRPYVPDEPLNTRQEAVALTTLQKGKEPLQDGKAFVEA